MNMTAINDKAFLALNSIFCVKCQQILSILITPKWHHYIPQKDINVSAIQE